MVRAGQQALARGRERGAAPEAGAGSRARAPECRHTTRTSWKQSARATMAANIDQQQLFSTRTIVTQQQTYLLSTFSEPSPTPFLNARVGT